MNRMHLRPTRAPVFRRPPGALALLLGLFATACDGENLFQGGTQRGLDTTPPIVEIRAPAGDATFPVGDSVLIEAFVADDRGVVDVEFSGIALRGNPELGTLQEVRRFASRRVEFDAAMPDTTVRRFLVALPDSAAERVLLIATARDSTGNIGADTASVLIGGPRIQIRTPIANQQVQAGRDMQVLVHAYDPAGVARLQIDYAGAVSGRIERALPLTPDSVLLDTIIRIPAGALGRLTVEASARNALDAPGRGQAVSVDVTAAGAADTVAPTVRVLASGTTRMELDDRVRVTVQARDNSGGSGLARVGVTVLALRTKAGDTLVAPFDTTFAVPRTGEVVREFSFSPRFRADSLALPDTVIFHVHAWALDAAGNCAAAVADQDQRIRCADFRGSRVADALGGQRVQTVAVAGRTIMLPGGGTIADAVVDTVRRRLYLSNFTRSHLDILDLPADTFYREPVRVGSHPWGLAMNRHGDTLLVANSSGTSISQVYVGGALPLRERAQDRLLTPNVVLFEIELKEASGLLRYAGKFHDFSDRPQFLAQDDRGRVLYSTVPTNAAPPGTIRFMDAGFVNPEVRLLFAGVAVNTDADKTFVLAQIDSVTIWATAEEHGTDMVSLYSHRPGSPGTVLVTPVLPLDSAVAYMDNLIYSELVDLGRVDQFGIYRVYFRRGTWNIDGAAWADTTFVAASGDRRRIAFGEGGREHNGRIVLWDAATATISYATSVADLIHNASERVLGIGLNHDGTIGIARGQQAAYYFSPDLRLQGMFNGDLGHGGAGATLHPRNRVWSSGSDVAPGHPSPTSLSFIATGRNSVKIVDTYHFYQVGEIAVRDVISGPLRASMPLATDNVGLNCPATGSGDPNCVILKLYGVTTAGGVVVVNVRRRDIS
jgi:hypothetical protein